MNESCASGCVRQRPLLPRRQLLARSGLRNFSESNPRLGQVPPSRRAPSASLIGAHYEPSARRNVARARGRPPRQAPAAARAASAAFAASSLMPASEQSSASPRSSPTNAPSPPPSGVATKKRAEPWLFTTGVPKSRSMGKSSPSPVDARALPSTRGKTVDPSPALNSHGSEIVVWTRNSAPTGPVCRFLPQAAAAELALLIESCAGRAVGRPPPGCAQVTGDRSAAQMGAAERPWPYRWEL